MKKFYSNIGKKIQLYAKIVGVIGIIAGIVVALVDVFSGFDYEGIMLACGLGGACVWLIGSWSLYAFGQITDDIHKMANENNQQRAEDEDEIPEI